MENFLFGFKSRPTLVGYGVGYCSTYAEKLTRSEARAKGTRAVCFTNSKAGEICGSIFSLAVLAHMDESWRNSKGAGETFQRQEKYEIRIRLLSENHLWNHPEPSRPWPCVVFIACCGRTQECTTHLVCQALLPDPTQPQHRTHDMWSSCRCYPPTADQTGTCCCLR